jgi:hypothetical protein
MLYIYANLSFPFTYLRKSHIFRKITVHGIVQPHGSFSTNSLLMPSSNNALFPLLAHSCQKSDFFYQLTAHDVTKRWSLPSTISQFLTSHNSNALPSNNLWSHTTLTLFSNNSSHHSFSTRRLTFFFGGTKF